jgi:hypothetical protein
MKKAAEAVLQFTGYPLPRTETADNKPFAGGKSMAKRKEPEASPHHFFHVHQLTIDPLAWDGDWFGQYE